MKIVRQYPTWIDIELYGGIGEEVLFVLKTTEFHELKINFDRSQRRIIRVRQNVLSVL